MRYLLLLLLNVPIISIALLNLITRFKLKKITKRRFRIQISIWAFLLIILISSFPLYNFAFEKELLDSSELSVFDIAQTTAIIFLLYIMNNLRQRTEDTEHRLRALHQELSIRLSKTD